MVPLPPSSSGNRIRNPHVLQKLPKEEIHRMKGDFSRENLQYQK